MLVNGQETWGVIELGYRFPDDTVKPKISGKIKMTGFTNFCPYTVDLDYYKDARAEFTVSEWIDVLLGAIDYNAAGYKDEDEKLSMLTRFADERNPHGAPHRRVPFPVEFSVVIAESSSVPKCGTPTANTAV